MMKTTQKIYFPKAFKMPGSKKDQKTPKQQKCFNAATRASQEEMELLEEEED